MTRGSDVSPGLGYVPALDGIRAVAVALVFFYHCHVPPFSAGFIGVHIFFVLSGFLITRLLLRTPGITSARAFPIFMLRRLGRLYPALVVAVLFAGLLWPFTGARVAYADVIAPALGYYANWVIAEHGFRAMDPLGPLWSLAVEGQFYLLWPWFLKAHMRLGRRGAALALCGWTLAVAAARYAGHRAGVTWAGHTATLTCLDVLVVGAVAGLVPVERVFGTTLLRVVGTAAVLSLLASALWGEPPFADVWFAGGYTFIGIATAAWVAAVLAEPAAPLARLCRLRPLVWLGQLSYGVYLFHFPIIRASQPLHSALGEGGLLGLRMVATLLIAWLCHRLVEQPLRRATRTMSERLAGTR